VTTGAESWACTRAACFSTCKCSMLSIYSSILDSKVTTAGIAAGKLHNTTHQALPGVLPN
jgi:hypothetical protein